MSLIHAHAVGRFGERGQRGRDEVEGRGVGMLDPLSQQSAVGLVDPTKLAHERITELVQ